MLCLLFIYIFYSLPDVSGENIFDMPSKIIKQDIVGQMDKIQKPTLLQISGISFQST